MSAAHSAAGDLARMTCQKISATQFEADRRKAGISQSELFLRTGIAVRKWQRWLRDDRILPPALAKRVRRALQGETVRPPTAADHSDDHLKVLYAAALQIMCRHYGVTVADVESADPHMAATGVDLWRRCRHAHQAAIYLINVALGVRQKRLAEVVGLTPAAVCLALKSVEDRRDDPGFDAAMRRAHREFTGRDE